MNGNFIYANPGTAEPRFLTKEDIRKITQEIEPEQVQYVADVKCIGDECCKMCDPECAECKPECKGRDAEELGDNIVFICKIIAFCDKLRVLHWAAPNMSYHNALDDFLKELEEYKDAIAENIQGVLGFQFTSEDFTQITLPVEDNPICVLNELKICLQNFMAAHADDAQYEGCRNATSGILETVFKYLYIFRICKKD